jgi:hypothetical protein
MIGEVFVAGGRLTDSAIPKMAGEGLQSPAGKSTADGEWNFDFHRENAASLEFGAVMHSGWSDDSATEFTI